MHKLDKTMSSVSIGDMTYVREVIETDFCNCMCYISSSFQSAYFLSWFELVILIFMYSKTFKAYILPLHTFSCFPTASF